MNETIEMLKRPSQKILKAKFDTALDLANQNPHMRANLDHYINSGNFKLGSMKDDGNTYLLAFASKKIDGYMQLCYINNENFIDLQIEDVKSTNPKIILRKYYGTDTEEVQLDKSSYHIFAENIFPNKEKTKSVFRPERLENLMRSAIPENKTITTMHN